MGIFQDFLFRKLNADDLSLAIKIKVIYLMLALEIKRLGNFCVVLIKNIIITVLSRLKF